MPITPPTFDELFLNFRTSMEAIGFTHWSEGSRIGAIGKVFAAYIRDQWDALADLEAQSNPKTARGIYLDRIGEMFGVRRLPPQSASTLGRGPAIKFTNNGSTPLTVPLNSRVWGSNDPDIAFFTTQAVNIAAGGEGFVDVVAGQSGELHNVGVGVLNQHNAGMSQLSVTNVRPIGGGSSFESDDAYRFRISQSLQSKNGATEIAIRQALLRVPGVKDALVQGGVRGNGSVDVIVVPIDRVASADLLSAANVAVADTVAAGISWRVSPPKTRKIDLKIQLRLVGGTTIDQVAATVESAVRTYVDNLRVNDGNGGSDMIYNELISRVQDADPNILDSIVDIVVDGVPSLQTNVTTKAGERLVSGSVSVK
jgi:uncharacterized phage protein gp47/JayE